MSMEDTAGAAGQWPYSAFISHDAADRRFAERVCRHLEKQGLRCWVAPRDVRPGHDYGEEIVRGIESAKALVIILSKEANGSRFVKAEVERAYSKGKAVFPVRREEVLPSPGLELFVSSSHWIDAWHGDLAQHVERLARTIEGHTVVLDPPGPRGGARRWLAAVAAGVVVAAGVGGGILFWDNWFSPKDAAVAQSGDVTTSTASITPTKVQPKEPVVPDVPEEEPTATEGATSPSDANADASFVSHRIERTVVVHEKPTTVSATIERLRAGDVVKAQEIESARWVRVRLDDGRTGYVRKDATRRF